MAKAASDNRSYREPPFKDGDVIEAGNFCQLAPDTEICADVRDLTINGGNFANCKPQPTWTVNGGNWAQIDRCSHLHPELIAKGLPECPDDCRHRQGHAKQWIEVEETEFRAHMVDARAAKPSTPSLRIEEDQDADGIRTQRLQKLAYVYRDKVTVPMYIGIHRDPIEGVA